MTLAIHVTHEAVKKIGGIGAVLDGLLATRNYQKRFPRTLLYAPLFNVNDFPFSRRPELEGVEKEYGVRAFFGKKEPRI